MAMGEDSHQQNNSTFEEFFHHLGDEAEMKR